MDFPCFSKVSLFQIKTNIPNTCAANSDFKEKENKQKKRREKKRKGKEKKRKEKKRREEKRREKKRREKKRKEKKRKEKKRKEKKRKEKKRKEKKNKIKKRYKMLCPEANIDYFRVCDFDFSRDRNQTYAGIFTWHIKTSFLAFDFIAIFSLLTNQMVSICR